MDHVLRASCCVACMDTPVGIHAPEAFHECTCIRVRASVRIAHICPSFPSMSRIAGFEESGVSDPEGLLAMMHQRYHDVSIGKEGGGAGRCACDANVFRLTHIS